MYFKNNRTALVFLLAMLAVAPIKAQVAFGDAAKFNDGWLFRLTDDSAIVRTDYDDSAWRKLSLPHDWSIEGQLSPTLASCTGYLPGGIGWYRKHFRVEDNATRHYIYFEGVYAWQAPQRLCIVSLRHDPLSEGRRQCAGCPCRP